MAITFILDRRKQEDRRSFESPSKIPVITSNGIVVQRDRRRLPDRRNANIQVKEHFLNIGDNVLRKFVER